MLKKCKKWTNLCGSGLSKIFLNLSTNCENSSGRVLYLGSAVSLRTSPHALSISHSVAGLGRDTVAVAPPAMRNRHSSYQSRGGDVYQMESNIHYVCFCSTLNPHTCSDSFMSPKQLTELTPFTIIDLFPSINMYTIPHKYKVLHDLLTHAPCQSCSHS